MKSFVVRMMLLAAIAIGLAGISGIQSPVRAQDEPYPGSFEIGLGEQGSVVAKLMARIPVILTCTMPSVPWETGNFSESASLTLYVSQAVHKTVASGEASLYNLASVCDGTPHTVNVEVIADVPFKKGDAVVRAFGGVSFVAWDPQYVELNAGDSTGNQVVKLK